MNNGYKPNSESIDSNLVNWTRENSERYGTSPIVSHHNMHTLEMFSDQSLIELLDDYPRDRLQVFTMGLDPKDRSQWQPVDTRGASGKDILDATAVGRLWVKLMRTELVSDDYASLLNDAYSAISHQNSSFESQWLRSLLLISSPGALVYYHADAQNMMLWQLRGSKRVWVYPRGEPFLIPRHMEEIFSGDADEELPYEETFDEAAFVHDLEPGQVLSWPLNSPHRVTNHNSVNVSLSVTIGTDDADRRSQLYQANLLMRRRFGIGDPSVKEDGIVPYIKRNAFRVTRKLGIAPGLATTRQPYVTNLRIDASSPRGVSEISSGPVQTLF